MELDELYQDIILDHSRRPRNFGGLSSANAQAKGNNPSCGDEIELYLTLNKDVISDVKFSGQGCAISQASASMMTIRIKEKSKQEALDLYEQFHQMLTNPQELELPKALGDLRILKGVRKYPQRVKCATLAWQALRQALTSVEQSEIVTTDDSQ